MTRIVAIVLVLSLLLGGFVMAGVASYRGISAPWVGPEHPRASVRDQSLFGPWFTGGGPGAGK